MPADARPIVQVLIVRDWASQYNGSQTSPGGDVTEPLLFVCIREPSLPGGASTLASFLTIENPTGPAFVAFASEELAAAIILFYGRAANVFLVPETQLTAALVGSLTRHRVLIYRTADDYNDATSDAPDFPWAEHMIDYDFAAALARVLSN